VPPDSDPSSRYDLVQLLAPARLARLAIIGVIVVAVVAAFAWAGGWFSLGRLDQARMIDTFEAINGPHQGFRRNHAKGVCLTGHFDSNGTGTRYSKAQIFQPGRVPVFGRFALAGGMPRAPDSPVAVRSMALSFNFADGEVWRTGMNDIPVFAVKDAQGFYDQLVASRPDPRTGKPDTARVKAFLIAHPETRRATTLINAKPFASGFANATFNSLDAFLLVDSHGRKTPVRWAMVPEDAFTPEPALRPQGSDYLFDELIARVHQGSVRWHLVLTLGLPGDPTNDATLPWPANRLHLDVGSLTVTALQTEAAGNCRDINFDPLVLPAGIAPSDDPLLSARSAAYSVSFTRRVGEPKSPSIVQVSKGA
jgi:catalase